MRICIIGGGNIGTQFACICASKGHGVNMFTSKPELFSTELEVIDENDHITVGKIVKATNDLKEAVEGCQILFVTYPAFKLQQLAEELAPYVVSGMHICVIPGTGGAEFAFAELIRKGVTLLGLQRVPSVARLEQYGKRVRCEGLRDALFLASIPSERAGDMCTFLEELWGIPCKALPNYLSVTLTPSNPILHTTRLKTLFGDYHEGMTYSKNPLFYGEWDDSSSALLLACDAELQTVCHTLDCLDLSDVRSLKLHYESDTVEAMTKKIRSIPSLHNLHSPMKKIGDGWVPDLSSRYFTADFPFGLALIEQFAKICCVPVPNISHIMEWYRNVTGDCKTIQFSDYGIHTAEDIYQFYQFRF